MMNDDGNKNNMAIDNMYEVYGQNTVTQIIDKMRKDEWTGGNPALFGRPQRVNERWQRRAVARQQVDLFNEHF
jgi:hypothetical protein